MLSKRVCFLFKHHTTGLLGNGVLLTSVVLGVVLLQGGDGLLEAPVQTFDQNHGGGPLGPADRVAVGPRPHRLLQLSWDTVSSRGNLYTIIIFATFPFVFWLAHFCTCPSLFPTVVIHFSYLSQKAAAFILLVSDTDFYSWSKCERRNIDILNFQKHYIKRLDSLLLTAVEMNLLRTQTRMIS